ncbi:uncharacterized protein [Dermacentor andersoni]|uniref:uncharacterized protein n=1 Tax=Dermacentor andersoni TaxID=34620 RepID=UPI00215573ED|nr:uncharacterized protein LOC126539264 [Dermacentor andersoni]
MPSLADSAAASSRVSTTTPLPVASLGPPASGPPLCLPDESVLESLVAVLVAAIIFLAALVLAVLLFACSSQQARREPPRCSRDHHHHHHHCKRRRRRTSQEVRSRARYCCSDGHDLPEDVEQYCDGREQSATPVGGGAPRRFDYGSSGQSSSPDTAARKSPYHPGYNSPATASRPSRQREGYRMARYTSSGAHSDLAPALHSTEMFQSSLSRHQTRERLAAAPAVGTARPPSGDTSDSSRHSGQTCVETGSDTRSLEWDNFQPPLAAAAALWPSSSELCTENSLSNAATDGSQQQRRPLFAESQHWV